MREAQDKRELAKYLRQQGYVLISAKAKEQTKEKKLKFSFSSLGGVKLTEKMLFTRNLQVMVASGVPLPRALKILSGIVKSVKFKNALSEIREEIIKGKSFSESAAKHPKIFSELFYNMLQVGEEAGTMEEVLGILTKQMEKEHELKSKIQGAMIYPAVIISAMLGVGVLMLAMVVPKLAETFDELNIELPIATQFVIFLGTFLVERWYVVILLVIVLAFALMTGLKTKKGGKIMDTVLLKIPVVSSLIKKTNSAYTVRTLGSLIESGVPIVRALNIISGTAGNFYYKKALKEIAAKVQKGEKLSDAINTCQSLYPIIVIQMIKVGEETGETSNILTKLADFFEQEVAVATENLSAVIEPVLMLAIGGAVGFFAVSMIQPMYSMLEAI